MLMTDFNCCIPPTRTTVPVLPPIVVQEAKERRRKVLEAARNTKRANYRLFMQKKCQLQAGSDMLNRSTCL